MGNQESMFANSEGNEAEEDLLPPVGGDDNSIYHNRDRSGVSSHPNDG